MSALKVYRNRTNLIPFLLNMDVTGETLIAQIRSNREPGSQLLATFTVTVDDSTVGAGTLLLDDVDANIGPNTGWTDILRVSAGGDPITIFGAPLKVQMIDMPTAVVP